MYLVSHVKERSGTKARRDLRVTGELVDEWFSGLRCAPPNRDPGKANITIHILVRVSYCESQRTAQD